jgi:RNA polymerase sigma-70 factor, ECF subfamily
MIVLVLPDLPAEDLLLAQARQGNQDAIMRIYESYFPPIYQFIRFRVADPHHAEDLASEVFVRFIESIRKRKAPRASLRGWLFRVARNLLYHHHGQNRQFPVTTLEDWMPMPSDDDVESGFLRTLDVERTRQALRMLAEEQQEVLILRFGQMLYGQECKRREVAAIPCRQHPAPDSRRVESTGRSWLNRPI